MLSSPPRAERKFMYKNTRDINAAECMIWMYVNNPKKVDIYMDIDYPLYLISLVPISQLKFPDGWYYAHKTKTINKFDSSITVRVVIQE